MRISSGRRWLFDWPLFVTVAAISLLGLTNLMSATSVRAAWSDIYLQQIYWLTFGTGVAVLVAVFDYRQFARFGWAIYGAGLLLLGLVFLLGKNVRGSTRWIGFGEVSIQPSELMKIALIVGLATYLQSDPRIEGRSFKDLAALSGIVVLPLVLVLVQPDLGTAVILGCIFASIMVMTHIRLRTLLMLLAALILSAPLAWPYLEKYQRNRVLAFLFPDDDPLKLGWHARQSRVAIGSGGMQGKGFMESTQNKNHFLPDPHTDFPFAVWGEEQGLLGVTVILGLYLFLTLWGLKIATEARDRFGSVVAVGVSAMIFWHAIVNMGMALGVLPVVGVTLPLFSYGGSSVLATMIGVGLLMNISIRRFSF